MQQSCDAPPVEKELIKRKKCKNRLLPYTPITNYSDIPKQFTVVDIETTGLSWEKDHIVEIGAVRYLDSLETDTYHCLIHSPVPLPEYVKNLTGIQDDEVMYSGVSIKQALMDFMAFSGDDVLVGHNIAFDIQFLQAACAECQVDWKVPIALDTVTMARDLLPNCVSNYMLETLVRYLKLSEVQQHRALPDALLTGNLFLKLNEIYKSGT